MMERPNRDALNRAVDIFRDVMRPFIVRHMRDAFEDGAEEKIRGSLSGVRADEFMWSRRRGESVEDAIDVNDFPHIVRENWAKVFRSAFDGERAVQSTLGQIVDARNNAAHPGTEDVDLEYVRNRLYNVAEVLGRIGAEDERRAVEGIRDELVGRAGAPPRSGGYWVYEDRPTSQARVHRGACHYCNHGDGMGRGRIEKDNEWYGPFGSREDAFRRAEATGQRDVRGCRVCWP